jgi:hypothetical protein
LYAPEPKRLRPLSQAVLAALSFQMVPHLMHRGLSDIYEGITFNMGLLALLAHRSPPFVGWLD